MKKPTIPENEKLRIKALHDLNILDTPLQESFERITRLTKRLFDVPIVAFSLVDSERQWFKSIQGLDACETSREVSFCGHTINQDNLLIINDTLKDDRFADNPLVTHEPSIRFYAGFPIRSANQLKIGTLCLIDRKPRNFTPAELEPLKDMAALIESEIIANKVNLNQFRLIEELNHAKKASIIDGLTRLLNRAGIESLLQSKIAYAIKHQQNFGISLIDIDNFKKINDDYGHCVGDQVLREVAQRLLIGYRGSDKIGRWGGEEFLVIYDLEKPDSLLRVADRARVHMSTEPFKTENHELTITITTGISYFDWRHPTDLIALVSHADKALYTGKRNGKDVVLECDNEQENILLPLNE